MKNQKQDTSKKAGINNPKPKASKRYGTKKTTKSERQVSVKNDKLKEENSSSKAQPASETKFEEELNTTNQNIDV